MGALRRMAAYLGLVEEDGYAEYSNYGEYDEYDQERSDVRVRSGRHERGSDRSNSDRSNVVSTRYSSRRSGGRFDAAEYQDEDVAEYDDRQSRPGVRMVRPDRPTGPDRRTVRSFRPDDERPPLRPAPSRRPAMADFSRIETVHPRSYNDARPIGEQFREGIPVIMNLSDLDDTDAKRIIDFAAGLVFGLRGSIERVTPRVFLLSPVNVDVGDAARAQIAQRDFYNQS